jgi:fucose 4-O-acetylase-like acetyltransferase
MIWVDWLKGLVVLGVVLYHAAQPFVLTAWIVSDTERSLLLSGLAGLGYLFAMPLMFLLAGTASMLALQRRSVRRYLGIRLLRLGLPLVAGLVLLSPFESWVGHVSHGGTTAYPAFAVDYLANVEITLSPIWLGEAGHHLWFLGFLLGFVLVSLPALVWLRSRPAPRLAPGRPWIVLVALPPVALGLAEWPLRAAFPGYRDWADAALWLAYFGIGVLLVLDRGLVTVAARRGAWMLVPAVLLVAALLPAAAAGELMRLEGDARLDLAGLGYATARTGIGWALVLAALALGVRALDRWEEAGRRAGEASLAFYVLHHPIVIVVAALVVGTSLSMWPKFLLIAILSLLVTAAVYEGVVRRFAVLRAVFGVASPTDDGEPAPIAIGVEGAEGRVPS